MASLMFATPVRRDGTDSQAVFRSEGKRPLFAMKAFVVDSALQIGLEVGVYLASNWVVGLG